MENLQKLLIDAPVFAGELMPDDMEQIGNAYRVNANHPLEIRKAVHQYAVYFRREFLYDFVQYSINDGAEDDDFSHPYIWLRPIHPDYMVVIGACRFRRPREDENDWIFDWAWFHPYYRNHGLLSSCWSGFEQKYGKNFIVEPPLSPQMKSFLKNRNYLEHTRKL